MGYHETRSQIESSIRLGIEVERDAPELRDSIPNLTDKQMAWLGSWLAGEGFEKVVRGEDGSRPDSPKKPNSGSAKVRIIPVGPSPTPPNREPR